MLQGSSFFFGVSVALIFFVVEKYRIFVCSGCVFSSIKNYPLECYDSLLLISREKQVNG